MPTADAWEVQRKDPVSTHPLPSWITVYQCATGKPIRFTTLTAALAFAKIFARARKLAASEVRAVHAYVLASTDI